MKSVGVIGFGRFGKVLANILKKGYNLKVYDPNFNTAQKSNIPNVLGTDFGPVEIIDLDTVLKETVIFIAVPIRAFEEVIKTIAPKLHGHQTIIDVCSVKVHPTTVMKKYLPPAVGIVATHPLFGPDSYLSNQSIKMVMHLERVNDGGDSVGNKAYQEWKDFFPNKALR